MTSVSEVEERRVPRTAADLVGRLRAAGRDGAASYVAAVGVRTGARALWGLFIPVVLSVRAYGEYSVLVTMIAMVAQLAILGTPQTMVRNAGRHIPTLGLLAHALVLASVGLLAFGFIVPDEARAGLPVLLAAVAFTVAYTLFAARAKALFAFATALRVESVAAVTLLGALLLLLQRYRSCGDGCTSPAAAIVAEALAMAAAVGAFLVAKRTRLTRPELSPRGTVPLLGSVYSVGFLVVLDLVIWRRVEVYFLQHSPSGLTGVAVLGLAVQIANMLLLLPTSLVETWQPRLAIHHREDRQAFAAYFQSRQRIYLACVAGVLVAGLLLPPLAIPLAFPKYRPWLGYVMAFIAMRLVCAVAGFYSATLYAIGEERRLYAPVLVGSVISIISNAFVTVRYGLPGAIVAYGLTQVTVAVLTILAFRSAHHRPERGALHASGGLSRAGMPYEAP